LQYVNNATFPNPLTRQITVSANDGYNTTTATASVQFLGAAAAPVVDLNGGSSGINNTVTYTSGGVRIAPGAIISDSDSPQLNRVTIRLLNRPDNSDEALTANTSGTTVTALPYDPSTGVLTLVGSGSAERISTGVADGAVCEQSCDTDAGQSHDSGNG
jgi:hypothetical protein